ncbi:MAG: Dam family site-specific DNA-(adenine-N6)-methyltransferase [Oscillospiraceae bacterium]|nr:Dam family site-specific DNA-(adenine-N6)-methyltransferase [Oscillospiraceae bacterium]
MAKVSATKIADKLDISRSYLYYLKDNGVFPYETSENGQIIWSESLIPKIQAYLEKNKHTGIVPVQPEYKTSNINNRRYLGNKYKLLPFIEKVITENCGNIGVVADIFAGTGAVSSLFTDKKIITNDIMYSNYICNLAWFGAERYSPSKITDIIVGYNALEVNEENYFTRNFADTYFNRQDCAKIGFIREDIEAKHKNGEINDRERAILITSLVYAMDKIANTCGHYDAYRQGGTFDRSLELCVPVLNESNNENNICCNIDANELVQTIEADLVYIDPPYNSRQYCDAYHLLENVARWEKPEVFGVAGKMDRTALKSDYCTTKATKAFKELIKNIKAKYILFSYNNMEGKGNDRSNAKISDDDIFRILRAKGEVQVFSENYKAFTTGKSNISGNEERLFLCKCFDDEKPVISSPLNYIGGKFKLLPQILPLFPKNIGLFVDLFCGGCNVGINVNAQKVLFNDSNEKLLYLYYTFKNLAKEATFELVEQTIDQYGLSRSNENGYEFYGCQSSRGLGDFNKDGFLKLRKDYNARKNENYDCYIMLYVLIIYSFNNQIRFNRAGEFNLPVGKRDFNSKMKQKLSRFIDRLKSGDYSFISKDFREFDLDSLTESSFIYADPPYLITCATYNEQGGWNEQFEKDLLAFLDKAHARNIRFALSNVLRSKGRENGILLNWLDKNKNKYKAVPLDFNYANSSYQTKDKTGSADEVLIINY